jgi:hypothetical protein
MTDNQKQHNKTPSPMAAAAAFVIGLGLAYATFPADLDSWGSALYALVAVTMAIISGALAVLLWK